MNILLVYANKYEYLSPPPIGISLLTRPLQNAGHKVHVLDFMKMKDHDALLMSALKEHKPDIVKFSLRNMDNQNYKDSNDFIPDYETVSQLFAILSLYCILIAFYQF